MRLPGIDPIVLNEIRNQTAQKQIQESRQVKVTAEKKEREKQGKREQPSKRTLEESIKLLNQAMVDTGRALRFQPVKRDETMLIQIWDTSRNQVVREVPAELVLVMVNRIKDMLGMLMDEMI
ncbi:MAG: flagellar protein FlaG [Bacillota bacterium]